MKSICSFLLFALLPLAAVFGQVPADPEPGPVCTLHSSGIRGGVNVSSVSNLTNSEIVIGFHAGLFANLQIEKSFGLGGEFLLSKQGVSVANQDLNLTYLTVPVFLNYYDGPVTIQGGLYGAYLLKANVKLNQTSENLSPKFENGDLGLLIGFTYQASGPMLLGLRFNLGMADINKSYVQPGFYPLETRNFQLLAGFKF